MSIRNEQCKKVCKILDDVLANRPSERDALIVAVQKAFNALADDGWISCEDKLPEENGEYLVTRESAFYRYIDIVRKSNCNSDLPMASDIKAWMPLPKPYNPKEKNEK